MYDKNIREGSYVSKYAFATSNNVVLGVECSCASTYINSSDPHSRPLRASLIVRLIFLCVVEMESETSILAPGF